MFHRYLSKMYDIPSYIYIIGIILAIFLWAYLAYLHQDKRKWHICNRVILGLTLFAILFITILVRPKQQTGFYLNPMYAFELAKEFPDVYNQMVLNVVLFLPMGMTIPYAFKCRFPIVLTLSVSFLYTLVIEFLQYFLSRGYFEVGDLILNFTGSLIGAGSYLIYKNMHKYIQK